MPIGDEAIVLLILGLLDWLTQMIALAGKDISPERMAEILAKKRALEAEWAALLPKKTDA